MSVTKQYIFIDKTQLMKSNRLKGLDKIFQRKMLNSF